MPSESTTKSIHEKAQDFSRALAGLPASTGLTKCSLCFVRGTAHDEGAVSVSANFGIAMIDIPRRERLSNNGIPLDTAQSVLMHACGNSSTSLIVNFEKCTVDVVPYGFDPSTTTVRLQTHGSAGRYEIRRLQVHQIEYGMHRTIELPESLHAQMLLMQKMLEEITAAADIAVLRNVNEMIKLWESRESEVAIETLQLPQSAFAGALFANKATRI